MARLRVAKTARRGIGRWEGGDGKGRER